MALPASESAIQIDGLRVRYGDRCVLDGIDLHVSQGSICALLGVNGAGKTTAVRVLATLLAPQAGTVRVCGHDVLREAAQVRRVISLAGQHAAVDELLTGRENLRMMARLHRLADTATRVEDLLASFDLTAAADRRISTWSGGMRRRLDLAMTLVADPKVILLDEPTTGVDPLSRRAIWRYVKTLARAGITILLTTQYIEEAEQLADRVAILHEGKIVAHGTPAELRRMMPSGNLVVELTSQADLVRARTQIPNAQSDEELLRLVVAIPSGMESAAAVLAELASLQISSSAFAWQPPSLEEVFMSVVANRMEWGNAS